jgi:hypothetical protein
MTRARDIANLVDANGDIVAGALDNVPAADLVNDTTPQLGGALDGQLNDMSAVGNVTLGASPSTPKQIRFLGDDARIEFLNNTASYNLGTSGGAAIRFHRPSSGHEAIAFETHDTGVSHAERMRISPEGYVTMPYTPIVALQDKGTASAATQVITGWSVTRNNGNHFNNSTGLFTCPVDGYYEINFCAQSQYASAYNWIAVFHNGGVRENIHWNPDNNSGHYNLSLTHVLLAAANDTLGVGTHNANGAGAGHLADSCATIKLIG